MQPFDMSRIFIGDQSWLFILEILFRTAIMYFYTLLNIRLMGKRTMGQLSGFELIIIIGLGSAVGDPMFSLKVPITHGMAVISCISLIDYLLAWVAQKSRWFEKVTEGSACVLIKHGKVIQNELAKQNISFEELKSKLRTKKIRNIAQVEYAFFESSGELSIIPYKTERTDGPTTLQLD